MAKDKGISDRKDKKEEKKLGKFIKRQARKTKSKTRSDYKKSGVLASGSDMLGRKKERRGQDSDEGRDSRVGNGVGESNRFKGARIKSRTEKYIDNRNRGEKTKPEVTKETYTDYPSVEYGTSVDKKTIQKTSGKVGEGTLDKARKEGGMFDSTKAASSIAKEADSAEGKGSSQDIYKGAKPEGNTGLLRGKQEEPKTNEDKAKERAEERSKVYTFKTKGKSKKYMKFRKGKLRNTGKKKRDKAKHIYKFGSKQMAKDFLKYGGEKKALEAYDSDVTRLSDKSPNLKRKGRRIIVSSKLDKGERPGKSAFYNQKVNMNKRRR